MSTESGNVAALPGGSTSDHNGGRRSSGAQVADHLRREIFAGNRKPGTKIAQEEVARELGVSRIPVREALVILEREGRVRMEHHRGAFVEPMDEESIRDNAELFGLVFSFVARRAAERVNPTLLGELSEVATALASADPEDPMAAYRAAERFMGAILDAGVAPRMKQSVNKMRALSVDNIFEVVPGSADVTRAGILALIEAVRSGDPERAATIQMDMQRASADLVVAEFRRRGVITADEAAG